MTPQAYKDEVQPAEKTPADVEQTKGAFQDPPPQKKSEAYKVLFELSFFCFVVGLISYSIWHSVEGELEGMLVAMLLTFAFGSGVVLLASGLITYLTDRKER